MKREIKFRAWIKQDGKFFKESEMLEPETLRLMMDHKQTSFPGTWTWEHIEIMQYTGLRDKTGKEIYEGDIVSDGSIVDDEGTPFRADVIFEDGAFRFGRSNCDCGECESATVGQSKDCIEIIGNIYEHPELLK